MRHSQECSTITNHFNSMMMILNGFAKFQRRRCDYLLLLYVIVLALMVQCVIISYSCYCILLLLQGANFRDLTGVLVQNNRVKFDPSIERPKLKSGKFLVQMNQLPALWFSQLPFFC